jgi:hypothetical protein
VKGVIHDQKQNKYKYSLCFSKNNSWSAGDVAQWLSICLACMRL